MSNKRRKNSRISIEQLETRIMPTGTVTAAISNRILTIKGDSASNTIDLYQTDVIDEYKLVGNATTLKVNGVTKSSLKFNMNDVDVINISMGDGNDKVSVRGVNSGFGDFDAPKGMKIETGTGNDRVVLKYVNVWENDLDVYLGSGDDTLDADNVNVDGLDFAVFPSTGANSVKITNSSADDDVTVASSFSSSNRVTLNSVAATDRVSVDLSDGVDIVNLVAVKAKVLDVDLYGSNDKLSIKSSKFTVSATIDGGAGNNNLLNYWNNIGDSGWIRSNILSPTRKDLFYT
jgi:hypothetical protein